MAEGSYVAVYDWMKYAVKPSAVRSENYLHTTSKYEQQVVFFSCAFGQDNILRTVTGMYGSRGPESMFRRVMIQDGAI